MIFGLLNTFFNLKIIFVSLPYWVFKHIIHTDLLNDDFCYFLIIQKILIINYKY